MDVCVIVPPGSYVSKLEALGARCIPIAMNRFITPLQDLKLVFQLYSIFRAEQFDLVHNMTIKPNIFGTLAAKLAGIQRIVCLVSGIGYVFSEELNSKKNKAIRIIATFLYKIALAIAHKTWFQNKDDLDLFVERKIIKPDKGIVIRSGGINLNEYSLSTVNSDSLEQLRNEFHIEENSRCVVMVAARLIWSKGVREFIEASELLKSAYPDWVFLMVCPQDPGSPDSVPQDYIETHKSDNLIVVDYFRDDIKNIIALADIMVLVSYYREGVPRTLLEGLSMSKPIIASNSVGCKEVVEHGKNGFLVPVKDSQQLAEKLKIIMDDENKRTSFGKSSRELAKNYFDENIVIHRVFTELYEIV
jgi:N,N'-diacetylbacillosaminyl-diphospho-undecaprenol alpha-1,3-N-acetylgalactosaminyltransferase